MCKGVEVRGQCGRNKDVVGAQEEGGRVVR